MCNGYRVEGELCGLNGSPYALEFDHIEPSEKYRTASGKKLSPAEMVKDYSLQTVLSEIAKCRVLCANCHAVHTHEIQRGRG